MTVKRSQVCLLVTIINPTMFLHHGCWMETTVEIMQYSIAEELSQRSDSGLSVYHILILDHHFLDAR